MPHKYNADRRHHIARPKRRVTNWSAYNEALRQRGSLTVWFTDDAIAAWKAAPRTTPGGQPHYSDLAITTALTLRAVFRLALRQTEGLIGSVLQLLDLDLPVPDFSTLSRRAQSLELPAQTRLTGGAIHLLVDSSGLKLSGPGEWLLEKHRTSKRRSWRKPRRSPGKGRMAWQRASGYNERAGVEGQFARWKQVIGDGLRFHSDQARATEVAIAAQVLNRMLDLGCPNSVRVA
jgi:hypothetical protein